MVCIKSASIFQRLSSTNFTWSILKYCVKWNSVSILIDLTMRLGTAFALLVQIGLPATMKKHLKSAKNIEKVTELQLAMAT